MDNLFIFTSLIFQFSNLLIKYNSKSCTTKDINNSNINIPMDLGHTGLIHQITAK